MATLDWDEDDLDRESTINDTDLQLARQWNARFMPAPMDKLIEAPAVDTDVEARAGADPEA